MVTEVEVRMKLSKERLKVASVFNTALYGPHIEEDGVIRIWGPHVSQTDEIEKWFFTVLRFAQRYAIGHVEPNPWDVKLPIDEDRSICIYCGLINIVMHKLTGHWLRRPKIEPNFECLRVRRNKDLFLLGIEE